MRIMHGPPVRNNLALRPQPIQLRHPVYLSIEAERIGYPLTGDMLVESDRVSVDRCAWGRT
ncbi:hypothetical protein [Streptomyces sp. NPDC002176]|uniref:hypothetical protein n=1 Tax=Streptomyces sp. NPDC002176 TaxID=3364634 RepID=UPI00384D2FD3